MLNTAMTATSTGETSTRRVNISAPAQKIIGTKSAR
jgi:hypothetical protein